MTMVARQPAQQVGVGDDLVAAHVDLHVPADVGHAPGQRLDHVDAGDRGRRIEHRKADAAHAAGIERPQLAVADLGKHHGDAAGVAEPGDGVERDAVVGAVGRRLHDDGASRADPLLQPAIVGHTGVGLHARARPRRREALGVVDVHMAIACARRRLELGARRAGRVRHLVALHCHRPTPWPSPADAGGYRRRPAARRRPP